MKTTTQIVKTIAGGLAIGLALATPLYAQMGSMQGMSHQGGMMGGKGMMGMGGMMRMMGSMKMHGTMTMNGKTYPMTSTMMSSKAMMGKGMMGKGMMGKGMMGKGMMGMMHKPMKMAGTMTMMGHTYHCTMTMTPQGK